MSSCERLRPLIFRVVEGEASALEALEVAKHLPGCTACRIRLSKERRLAGVLERIEEPLGVEEGFVARVMNALPEGPPPGAAEALRRGIRRGLKLVAFGGGMLLAAGAAVRLFGAELSGRPLVLLPQGGVEGAERLLEGLGGAARLALVTAGRLVQDWPAPLPGPAAALPMLGLLALATAAAVGTGSMLLALAARSLTRR
jgi:hypothetical protein